VKIVAMRILVIGGAGYVAGLVLPILAGRHTVRILDRKPGPTGVEQVTADATDPDALRAAVAGVDAVVHCAMGTYDSSTPAGVADAYDVNVKSVHLALAAAHEAGVSHAVHVSSLSVFGDLECRSVDEDTPPDATDVYGLTKRLGEEVCRAAVAEWGMSVTVLRLALPTPDELWPAWGIESPAILKRTADGTPIEATAGSDLARAVLAALEHRAGFQVFSISGDRSARLWSTDRARRVLGWEPSYPRG
jgi:nucleoside-diphosphate-sugar epimerase